jgi:hypothetical protein
MGNQACACSPYSWRPAHLPCVPLAAGEITLLGCRHPCLEAQEGVEFIPNDCRMVKGKVRGQMQAPLRCCLGRPAPDAPRPLMRRTPVSAPLPCAILVGRAPAPPLTLASNSHLSMHTHARLH